MEELFLELYGRSHEQIAIWLTITKLPTVFST